MTFIIYLYKIILSLNINNVMLMLQHQIIAISRLRWSTQIVEKCKYPSVPNIY